MKINSEIHNLKEIIIRLEKEINNEKSFLLTFFSKDNELHKKISSLLDTSTSKDLNVSSKNRIEASEEGINFIKDINEKIDKEIVLRYENYNELFDAIKNTILDSKDANLKSKLSEWLSLSKKTISLSEKIHKSIKDDFSLDMLMFQKVINSNGSTDILINTEDKDLFGSVAENKANLIYSLELDSENKNKRTLIINDLFNDDIKNKQSEKTTLKTKNNIHPIVSTILLIFTIALSRLFWAPVLLAYVFSAIGYFFGRWYLRRGKINKKLIKNIATANYFTWFIPVIGFMTLGWTYNFLDSDKNNKTKFYIGLSLSILNSILGILYMV